MSFAAFEISLDAQPAMRARTVLTKPVSLSLRPGDCVLLRAANGVGKSSLLRQIAGFSVASAIARTKGGAVCEAGELIAYLGHANGIFPHDRVKSVLDQAAALEGRTIAFITLRAVAEDWGLIPLLDAEMQRLSAGQKRRVALARLILREKPVWLLDEPAAPLDDGGKIALSRAVAAHRARGGAVIAAVHATPDWPDCVSLTLEAAG